MKKINVGIIGSGNIGCDLLVKIQKSKFLQSSLFMGRNFESRGMIFANNMGINISDQSIDAIIKNPGICDIVFDATTAKAHKKHADILKDLNKFTIDLTPSLIGKACIPVLNSEECLDVQNINMITCGGQAVIPIVHAISCIEKIKYVETVSSISAKSAGPGTRANIDEFTQTTKDSILKFSNNVKKAKSIIIINPAEPPIMMQNTVYVIIDDPSNINTIEKGLLKIENKIQEYVPKYKIKYGHLFEKNRLTIIIQVIGNGDYLPPYAGNLDIITSSAVYMAEKYAKSRLI